MTIFSPGFFLPVCNSGLKRVANRERCGVLYHIHEYIYGLHMWGSLSHPWIYIWVAHIYKHAWSSPSQSNNMNKKQPLLFAQRKFKRLHGRDRDQRKYMDAYFIINVLYNECVVTFCLEECSIHDCVLSLYRVLNHTVRKTIWLSIR